MYPDKDGSVAKTQPFINAVANEQPTEYPVGLSKSPNRSNRGSYLSLEESNTSLDAGLYGSKQTESVLLASSHLAIAKRASDLITNGSIGIDKIRLSVPLFLENIDLPIMLARLLGNIGSIEGKAVIPNFPSVYIRWDKHRQRLFITFNPSEFVWPQGFQLCPFSLLEEVCRICIWRLLHYGDPQAIPRFLFIEDTGEVLSEWPSDWSTNCEVFTLHVAQDFLITDSRFNLSQLEGNQPKKTRAGVSVRNKGVLNTISHIAGKKATKLNFYNKSHERIDKPRPDAPALADGTFRFEGQVPRRIIKRKPISTLAGCTENNLKELLDGLWEDSKLGKDLIWEGSLPQELLKLFPPMRANELYGYAFSRQLGVNTSYTGNEIKRLESDLNQAKVDLRIPLSEQGAPYGRLDPLTGSLSLPLRARARRKRGNPFSV